MKVHKFVSSITTVHEAVLVDTTNVAEVAEWCGARAYWDGPTCPTPCVHVPLADGSERSAFVGDWVLRYPMQYHPDAFWPVTSERMAQGYLQLAAATDPDPDPAGITGSGSANTWSTDMQKKNHKSDHVMGVTLDQRTADLVITTAAKFGLTPDQWVGSLIRQEVNKEGTHAPQVVVQFPAGLDGEFVKEFIDAYRERGATAS